MSDSTKRRKLSIATVRAFGKETSGIVTVIDGAVEKLEAGNAEQTAKRLEKAALALEAKALEIREALAKYDIR